MTEGITLSYYNIPHILNVFLKKESPRRPRYARRAGWNTRSAVSLLLADAEGLLLLLPLFGGLLYAVYIRDDFLTQLYVASRY